MSYIFRKLFSRAKFASCLYPEPFKSNKSLNLTILKTSPQQCKIFGIMAFAPGALLPHAIHFSHATFASEVNLKVWTLVIEPLTTVRLVTSSALQSRK